MLTTIYPIIIAVVGLILIFVPKDNGDLKTLGQILFFCGAFFVTWKLAGETFRFGANDAGPLRRSAEFSFKTGTSGPLWESNSNQFSHRYAGAGSDVRDRHQRSGGFSPSASSAASPTARI
jgi:hypothetical protein